MTGSGRRADPGTREEAVSGRWRLAWHGFFYLLLTYATVAALSGGPTSAAVAARLLPAVALGAWYWLWLWGPRRRARHATRAYLVGAAALWAALVVADPDFMILGIGVFAPLCLHHVGVALAVTLVVLGGSVWQLLAGDGRVPWPAVGGAVLLATGCLLMVGTVGAIVRQSRERQRLVDQLETTRAALASAERQAGVLAERDRLARDIHDTLTQGLVSVVMLLEAAEASLATGSPVDRHIQQALRSARDNLAESRRVVWALRPRQLTHRSLPDALEGLVGRLAEETGIDAHTVVTGMVRPLDAEVEGALLRLAQEALANVRRHAAASQVTITLSYLDDVATLDVQDEGVGFDPAGGPALSGGLGLRAMRERMEALGGSLAIESAPGQGTIIAAQAPATIHSDGRLPAGSPVR